MYTDNGFAGVYHILHNTMQKSVNRSFTLDIVL